MLKYLKSSVSQLLVCMILHQNKKPTNQRKGNQDRRETGTSPSVVLGLLYMSSSVLLTHSSRWLLWLSLSDMQQFHEYKQNIVSLVRNKTLLWAAAKRQQLLLLTTSSTHSLRWGPVIPADSKLTYRTQRSVWGTHTLKCAEACLPFPLEGAIPAIF